MKSSGFLSGLVTIRLFCRSAECDEVSTEHCSVIIQNLAAFETICDANKINTELVGQSAHEHCDTEAALVISSLVCNQLIK